MYLKFYNLNVKPFEISPDPKFLWVGEKHKEGFAALKYAILTGKGFISLTGDVGTGKTTLLNALAISVDDKYIFARIPDPSLDQLDFFNVAASAFAMNKRFGGKGDFLRELSTFLMDSYTNNKEAVLIIDEAQRIKPELLEEIRLISNIEKPDKKLLTIIFAGQPGFNQILSNNRALRNRLAFNYIIDPLTETETEKYISHRLKVAGSVSRIFGSSAIREIYAFSKGNPRQINIICDLALLYGYSAEAGMIEPAIIRECVKRTSVSSTIAEPLPEQRKIPKKNVRRQTQDKRAENPGGSWRRPIPAIRTTVGRHKTAYLALVPLIVLIAIIGFIYYGGNSNSSILKLRAFLEQARNSYAKPVVDAFLQNAQVVKVPVPKPAEKKPVVPVKNPDRENNSRDNLDSEFAAQAELIAGLQKRLQASQTDQAGLAGQVAEGRQAAALLTRQIEELAAQKQASENRFEGLQTAHNALAAQFEELKHKRDQVAGLETALAAKDRLLAQSEQRLQEQEKNLALVTDGKNKAESELAAQAALIADLQQRLQTYQDDQEGIAGRRAEDRKEAALLKGELEELTAQKQAAEARFEELQTAHNALAAEFEELKHKHDEAAGLETALAAKDRMLAQSEQRLQEQEKALSQVKDDKGRLDGKLAAQARLIADLQKRLEASQADRAALEDEFNKSRGETAQLQAQVEELKAKISAGQKKSSVIDALPNPASDIQPAEEASKSQNPADIIDWVLKKKSQ